MIQPLSRRSLIAAVGTTATVSFAGCSGNNETADTQTDAPAQNTATSSFFKDINISDNGDVVELTADQSEVDEDVFEVALVSDTGEFIESNPLAGRQDTVTYLLARSGRATNGTNYLRALTDNGDLVVEQELTLTYELDITDVSLEGERVLDDDGASNRWVFTAENAGNSAAQISGLYITEDAAASNPLISPIDSEESNKLYINEPRDHAAHIHAMTVGEDKQPVQDAIESGDPIAIPIHISLNNGNQLYKFTVEAVPSGEVLKDPANSSYANDVYYPSEVSLSVSEPATLVDPQ